MRLSTYLPAIALVLVSACSQSEPGAPATDIEQRLSGTAVFDVTPTAIGEGSALYAHAVALRTGQEADLSFELMAGDVALTVRDGVISLLDIDVAIADLSVPADVLPPSGLDLTNLHVSLARPTSAPADVAVDGRSLRAIIHADLVVDWAMVRNGVAYDLAPLTVSDLDLLVEAELVNGELKARIVASREGSFWSWADTFELRDLLVEFVAVR